MKYLSLTLPGMNGTPIDSGLPTGVPTGGLFQYGPNGQPIPGSFGTGLNFISAAILLVITIAFLFTLWNVGKGGLDLIRSQGRKEQVASSRDRIISAVWGIVVLFLCFIFLNVAKALFGVDLLPFFLYK